MMCDRFPDETLGHPKFGHLDQKFEFSDNVIFSLVANTKTSHGNIPKFMI